MNQLDNWASHTLTDRNQEGCMFTETSLLLRQRNDPFLKKIIPGDEKWVFYDNILHKCQWIDNDESLEPLPKVELQV